MKTEININNLNFNVNDSATENIVAGENTDVVFAPIEIGAPLKKDQIDPRVFDPRPPLGGAQDHLERSEAFEQKTTGLDRLYDMFGVDDTRVFGQNGKIVLDAGRGNDRIHVTKAKDGGVDVSVNGKKYHFTQEQAAKLEIRGGSGNDRIVVDENVKQGLTLKGGSGNDDIRGGGGSDKIYGGSGNDRLYGGGGDDYLNGGSGNDLLRGGRGNDRLHGGSGNDRLYGDAGNDRLYGGRGNDLMVGGRGRDQMVDNQGINRRVSDLADRLGDLKIKFPPRNGGFVPPPMDAPINNPKFKPSPDDEIMYTGGTPNFDETGGGQNFLDPDNSQFDEIGDLLDQLFDAVQNLFGNDSNVESLPDLLDDLTNFLDNNQDSFQNPGFGDADGDQFGDIMKGLRDFTMRFNPSVNPDETYETPTTGMDRLYDLFGVDDTTVNRRFDGKTVIDAGRGNDRINVTNAGDGGLIVKVNDKSYYVSPEDAKNLVIKGGSGDDNITVDPRVKIGITILGGSGNDRIVGGSGNDKIYGGSGNDRLYGGRGDDYVNGGRGRDQLHGGRGRDTLVRDNDDTIVNGGAGRDRIISKDEDFHLLARRRDWRA